MYLVSIYQYCIVALVFIVGKPFRKPFYTNKWFTGSLVFLMVVNLILTYNPFNWRALYDKSYGIAADIPMEWRNYLMSLIIVNSVVTIVWEKFIVQYISQKWNEYKEKKEIALGE